MATSTMTPELPLTPMQDAIIQAGFALQSVRERFDHAVQYEQNERAVGFRISGAVADAKKELAEVVHRLHQLAPNRVPAELRRLVDDPTAEIRARPVPPKTPPRPSPQQIAEQLATVLEDWDLFSNAPDRGHREVAQGRLRDSCRCLFGMDQGSVPEALRELVDDPSARIPKRT